jgi:hypothetical protein
MMRNDTVSQESAEGMETGPINPTSDDEVIFSTPNRQRIIVAGKCARAEQARLEKVLGLQDGRTPRPD